MMTMMDLYDLLSPPCTQVPPVGGILLREVARMTASMMR